MSIKKGTFCGLAVQLNSELLRLWGGSTFWKMGISPRDNSPNMWTHSVLRWSMQLTPHRNRKCIRLTIWNISRFCFHLVGWQRTYKYRDFGDYQGSWCLLQKEKFMQDSVKHLLKSWQSRGAVEVNPISTTLCSWSSHTLGTWRRYELQGKWLEHEARFLWFTTHYATYFSYNFDKIKGKHTMVPIDSEKTSIFGSNPVYVFKIHLSQKTIKNFGSESIN